MVTQKEILEFIRENEGTVQATLQVYLGGSRSNINHAIMSLKKKNLIKREVYGVSWKLYSNRV